MTPSRIGSALARAALIAAAAISSAGVVAAQEGSPLPSPVASPAAPSPWPAGSPVPSASPDVSPLTATVEVQAFDLGFTPTTIEAPASGTSRIVLLNTGWVAHNLTVDALGIQTVASRGGTGETFITDPPPGTYEFYCSVSGHREGGMVGTLIVR